MARPRIDIKWDGVDWTLEVIGAVGLLLIFGYAASNYHDLPDVIPSHFNASGVADGFSDKILLWILPLIALLLYAALSMVLRYPHVFNYTVEINEENAGRQYRNAVLMMRILKTVIVMTFGYLTYATIQNGLGRMDGLGSWFLPVFLTGTFGTIGVLVYRSFKLR
jgi:uncharacterized membrane protein